MPPSEDTISRSQEPPSSREEDRLAAETLLPIARAREATAEVFGILKNHKLHGIIALTLTFIASAASLIPVLLLRDVINIVSAGEGSAGLLRILGFSLVAAVIAGVLAMLAHGMLSTLIARLLATLRERAVASVLSIPPGRVERAGRGDVIGRVGADVAVLVGGVFDEVPGILGAAVLVLTGAFGIATLDWRLALAGLVAAPVYVWALRWYLARSAHLYRRQRRYEAELLGHLMASVDGRDTVRSHHLTEQRRATTQDASLRARDTSIRVFRIVSGLIQRENAAEFTGLASITVIGWLLIRGGQVQVGDVAAALIIFHRMFSPVGRILHSFDEIQRSGAALTRIVGLISITGGRPPLHVDPQLLPNQEIDIHIRNLHHNYPDGRMGLAGVDMDIPAGRTVALVGESGAGKSTVAGILSGMLPHEGAGSIHIAGRELSELKPAERIGLVAVASQETHLFAGTLRENLLLANPRATDDECRYALNLVGAQPWLDSLPDGLDTKVGSGGLAAAPEIIQRVALARIRLSPAAVVVLDETAAEDADLMAASTAAIAGRTALVVAHRLSQAAAADSVVVLADGKVAEAGPHEQLLARQGLYAELWHAWSGSSSGSESGRTQA